MPDLDQLLDTLVDDVTAGTRAPGAQKAITRARRRRAGVAVAAVGAVAVIAVGGGLAVGTLGGSERLSPVDQPTTAPSPDSFADFEAALDEALEREPEWSVSTSFPDGYDYAFNGPCAGDWSEGATSGGDGGLGSAGVGGMGYTSQGQAYAAAARFIRNLEACEATEWRTQPITSTGVVLASSSQAVAWILQQGTDVRVLQVPTTDGPPPLEVQADVAELLVAYHAWQNDESTTSSEAPAPVPGSDEHLQAILDVPGWSVTENPDWDNYHRAFNGSCSGNWWKESTSGGDGGIGVAGFPSEALAVDAAARLVRNLETCSVTTWRIQPIDRPGAVLAWSSTGVAWIQQKGGRVRILEVPTTDGPPPVSVQLEVADFFVEYNTWPVDER